MFVHYKVYFPYMKFPLRVLIGLKSTFMEYIRYPEDVML